MKNLIIGIVIVALLYVVNAMMSKAGFFGAGIDDYTARLLVFIAINVILATYMRDTTPSMFTWALAGVGVGMLTGAFNGF